MKKLSLLLTLTLGLGGSLSASTIYDNTTTDTNLSWIYSALGVTQIGDTVTLGGTDRLLGSATVQFFNFASTAGAFDAILRLWAVGSPVGAQIGTDFLVSNIAVSGYDLNTPGSGIVTVTFNNLNVVVPNNLVFTLETANPTGGVDMGVNIFGPSPSVGSSNDQEIVTNNGGFIAQAVNPGEGNLYLQLTAVPEPSTWLMLFSGVAMVGFARRKGC